MVTVKKVKHGSSADEPQDVFKDVTYFIVGDVSQDVINLLDQHGAKRDLYLSDIVSHVIADSTKPDEYSEAKELFERPVVTSQWVILSVKCGTQLPKELFALEGRLFSGLRVCPHQLEAEDAKALWGMVTYHGGHCQMALDNFTTHLVTSSTWGEKYEAAMQHSDLVKVVTPDWFTDSIRHKEQVEESVYHPRLLLRPKPDTPPRLQMPPVSEGAMMMGVRGMEPMDISPIPGAVPFLPGHSPGPAPRRKSSSSDELYRTNGSRPGTPSAKEALARMVSNRLHANTKPDIPDMPVPRSGLSPIMPQGLHSVSPGAQSGSVPPMSAAGLLGMPSGMGMPASGPSHASLGPGMLGQPGMAPTSMGMVHPGVPPPQQAMSGSGMPHPGMSLPVSVPHPTSEGGMTSGGMPSGGMGVPPVPTSMHMPMSGAGMTPHHPPPHPQPPFPPAPPHPHPHPPPPQAPHPPSPSGGPEGAGGREENNGVRTLRNITNNGTSPPAARPSPPVKINQMLGLGGQARPPPPAYPYPPQSPGTQQPALPPPHQPPPVPHFDFFGHEAPDSIPPDQCLLGCVFFVCDYQRSMGADEVSTWCKGLCWGTRVYVGVPGSMLLGYQGLCCWGTRVYVFGVPGSMLLGYQGLCFPDAKETLTDIIDQYGARVSPVYCEAVTHVLCCDQTMDLIKTKALEDEKRMVTAFWLNDCLMQKKMQPPWQALHIPLIFTGEKPCKNQIISITNFMGEERKRVKQMICAIGAKYTGYMTRTNSVLVCKRPGGMKFEKAKEWRVPVVNVQWLSDLVLGEMEALRLPVQMRYLQVGHARDFCADLTRGWQWMKGWKRPIRVSKETLQKTSQLPKKTVKTEADTTTNTSEPPAKKPKTDEDSPPPKDNSLPRIIFTGYCSSVVKRLTAIAEKLGGRVTDNPQSCTHLVSQKVTRTIKFFHAINTAKHIVTKEWLEESSLQTRFLEEEKYQLRDEAGEREVGCNIQESLRKAKTSPIFQGLVFYITPGVIPPVEELKKVIESAGGAVLKRRPSAKTTSKMRDDKGRSTFIVISCPNDLHLCRDLKAQKIDVYSAEMALTGVLRQELDWKMYRLDYQLYAM
ncbi:hypothetical protein ACOMHN_030339 [Nucella lapillus]